MTILNFRRSGGDQPPTSSRNILVKLIVYDKNCPELDQTSSFPLGQLPPGVSLEGVTLAMSVELRRWARQEGLLKD